MSIMNYKLMSLKRNLSMEHNPDGSFTINIDGVIKSIDKVRNKWEKEDAYKKEQKLKDLEKQKIEEGKYINKYGI